MKLTTSTRFQLRFPAAMCAGALAAMLCVSLARAAGYSPGGEMDIGDYQGHVDIPEIAGTPGTGGGGLWPPRQLEVTSPRDEWKDFHPQVPITPIPLPGDLPRDDDVLNGNGPMEVLPTALLPGSLAPTDGGILAPNSIPAPGGSVMIGLGVLLAGRRRRR